MGTFERLEDIFNKKGAISLYDIAVNSEVMSGAWLNRTIRTSCELSYPVGSVFTSLSCESWSDGGEYECQFDGNFEYVFSLRGNIYIYLVTLLTTAWMGNLAVPTTRLLAQALTIVARWKWLFHMGLYLRFWTLTRTCVLTESQGALLSLWLWKTGFKYFSIICSI